MRRKGLKTITALSTAIASALAVTGLVARKKRQQECGCLEPGCNCEDTHTAAHVPEPSVKKVSSRVKVLGKRKNTQATETSTRWQTKESPLTNEKIAKAILDMINWKNAATPEEAVDVRSIYFMRHGTNNTMVVDFYTGDYRKSRYKSELNWLWRDIFLADEFWHADFTKVRINVKNKRAGRTLETITCKSADIRKYLLKEISLEEFQQSWTRKKATTASKTGSKTPGKKNSKTVSSSVAISKIKPTVKSKKAATKKAASKAVPTEKDKLATKANTPKTKIKQLKRA